MNGILRADRRGGAAPATRNRGPRPRGGGRPQVAAGTADITDVGPFAEESPMSSVAPATVSAASNADLASAQGAAAVSVLKKALQAQASSAAQLIQALPQPALATSGTLGTRVNTFA